MYYTVTVSHNGKHYFTTADNRLSSLVEMKKLVKDFHKRFPTKDGFKITVIHWTITGQEVTNF
jgi:hypothetical protein